MIDRMWRWLVVTPMLFLGMVNCVFCIKTKLTWVNGIGHNLGRYMLYVAPIFATTCSVPAGVQCVSCDDE